MKKIALSALVASLLASAAAPALAAGEENGQNQRHRKGKFERMDSDGDGVVTKDEFMAHSEKRFSKMDADGDGKITKEESDAARARMKEKFGKMHDMRQEYPGGPEGQGPEKQGQ